MKSTFILSVFSTVIVCVAMTTANAIDFSKSIPLGASFGEVLGIWGEPLEKVEKGVKREVVWYYPDGAKVVFKDGRMRSYQPTKAVVASQAEVEAVKSALITPSGVQVSGETRDLVREIAKEVPSGPDGPAPEAPPPAANIGQPPLIPNQNLPGGRAGLPGVVPGEVLVDDGDQD